MGKKERSIARTAEEPGQAIHIDVCYVPAEHLGQEKLPAVSGSSGHLVIDRPVGSDEREYPGRVFAQSDLSFEAAMQWYVQATLERQVHVRTPSAPTAEPPRRWRRQWEQQEERHRVLQQRRQEDADWKQAKENHRQSRLAYRHRPKAERERQQAAWQAEQQEWQQRREQRRQQQQSRQAENQAWHARNQQLKEEFDLPVRSWIPVLVVIDNCTRQCLGLPVFRLGSKGTTQEVTAALAGLLPEGLRFLICDQGTNLRTERMADFAQEKGFVQVLIYRHRPQTNGIAERFVQTFKKWLRSESWHSVAELKECISRFQPEYNDRPHLGLAIPGLSPNEFANRIGLM